MRPLLRNITENMFSKKIVVLHRKIAQKSDACEAYFSNGLSSEASLENKKKNSQLFRKPSCHVLQLNESCDSADYSRLTHSFCLSVSRVDGKIHGFCLLLRS